MSGGTAQASYTNVKLEISCKGLRDRDWVGKSDPCAVVFVENLRNDTPQGYPSAPPQSSNYPPNDTSSGAYQPPVGYAQAPSTQGGYPPSGYGAPGPAPAGYPSSGYGAPTASFNAHNAAVGYSAPPGGMPPPQGPNGYEIAQMPTTGAHLPHGGYGAPQPGWYGQPGPGQQMQGGYGIPPSGAPPSGSYASGGWGQPAIPQQQYPPSSYGAPPNQPNYQSARVGGVSSRSGVGYHAPASLPEEVSSWREIGRTEVVHNNLNPHFNLQVAVPYRFEEIQNIRVGIWDIDNSQASNLSAQDFLGEIKTTLGDLVANGMTEKRLRAENKKNNTGMMGTRRDLGTITIIVHEDRTDNKCLVRAHITGKKLAKRDLFSSDPYLIISQINVGGHMNSRVQVYQSEVIKKDLNPVWNPMKFKITQSKSDRDKDIKLEFRCMDEDLSKDEEIGIGNCTLEELLNVKKIPLIHSKKKNRIGYKHSGELILQSASVLRTPTWIDYLQGGLRLHFTLAVDFTASNGPPKDSSSLHYTVPGNEFSNQYISAISAVGSVLRQYTQGDVFNAYGFGAILPGTATTSFGFPLSLGPDARCTGIGGVIQAYQHAVRTVQLSGPTNFAHLIESATRAAINRENTTNRQNYDVLLILTDGAVTDYNRTVEKIIDASYSAPLSIIIIGVGNADFRLMEQFDGDHDLLTNERGTRRAARDIVQFVPMNKFNSPYAPPGTHAHSNLASAVLAELPNSIVDYFITKETPILPMQRPMVPVQSFRK